MSTHRMGLWGLGKVLGVVVLACAGWLLIAAPAFAATFTVTKTADTNDGTCGADCSLREAMVAANNAVGADTISLPAGTFTLTLTGTGENDAATGDLDVGEDLTISGAGQASTIIDGNGSVILEQVFTVTGGIDLTMNDLTVQNGFVATNGENGGGAIELNGSTGDLTLTDVTLQNNEAGSDSAIGPDGGAIYVGSQRNLVLTRVTFDSNRGNIGGAIYSPADDSSLTITNSTFTNNEAFREDANAHGGAIHSEGELTITGSTFSGNQAYYAGSAISSFCNLTIANIRNSTFTNNSLVSGSADAQGVIESRCTLNGETDAINISHSTIAGNTSEATNTAGLFARGNEAGGEVATIKVRNSIVADNTDGTNEVNCAEFDNNSLIVSEDYNLESDNDCGFTDPNDQVSIPAITFLNIAGLADNGGETETIMIINGSVAVDTGVCGDIDDGTVATDQRGLARPENSICDIGAVERDQTNPALALNGSATVTHECATTYTDAGATATDNFHPNPMVSTDDSAVDASTPGSYMVDYTTSDYEGNADAESRTVNVTDTTDPEITLTGDSTVEVKQYATYTDAGATADDTCDTDPFTLAGFSSAATFSVNNPVNTSTVGSYSVTYTAEDGSGNSSTATRTVTVVSRGAVTDLEPLDNGKVRVTYADGSKRTFTAFPDATAIPKAELSTNGKRIVVLNKRGTKLRVLDAFSGEILDRMEVRENKQKVVKLKVFDYYPELNAKDEIIVSTKLSGTIRTSIVSLTKNSNLTNEDTEKKKTDKKNWKVSKKKTYLRLKELDGDLIVRYRVTKLGNLKKVKDDR